MTREERLTQFVAINTIPRTFGLRLHWDGLSAVSQEVGLQPVSVYSEPTTSLTHGQLTTGCHAQLPMMPKKMCVSLSTPPLLRDGNTEAEGFTFYLHPGLLGVVVDNVIAGASGTLLWVHQEGHGVDVTRTVHPALLVHTAYEPPQGEHVEVIPHLLASDPLRQHIALVLQALHNTDTVESRLYAETLANALAVHFLRRHAACKQTMQELTGGLSLYKLRQTIAYIQAHLEQELSLTVLAAVVQLSPAHFARLFKHTTGQTPHQYVLWCRIERAKQLLAETDMPLSAIGPQVGCTDQSYFSALFRKHVATTPKAYRDAIRGM